MAKQREISEIQMGLSPDDINFLTPSIREAKDETIIGRQKYNYLIELQNSHNLHNEKYPDSKPLELTELEKKQIVVYETDIHILSKEQEQKEKDYLQNIRSNTPKVYETTKGIPFSKKTLYNGFLEAYNHINKRPFILNDDSKLNLEVVIKYFIQDETFFNCERLVKKIDGINKELNPSFDKGFIIIGRYGNGKSSIMRTFEYLINHNYLKAVELKWDNINDWKNKRFKVSNTHDLVSEYEWITTPGEKEIFFNKFTTFRYCFDDLKKEKIASNYGNINVVQSLLEKRYDNYITTKANPEKQTIITFGTMNYETSKPNDLKEALVEYGVKYGGHNFDRLFELCNIFEFKGGSFRK